jgi:hypothetical protein
VSGCKRTWEQPYAPSTSTPCSGQTYRPRNRSRPLPQAREDIAFTVRAAAIQLNVLENDEALGQQIRIAGFHTQPRNGIVIQDGDKLVYTANEAFAGTETFYYTLDTSDGPGPLIHGHGSSTQTRSGNLKPTGKSSSTDRDCLQWKRSVG